MSMKLLSFGFLAALAMGLSGPAQAKPSLDEACARFSSKLESAVASGDSAKAKQIFKEGSKRVADNFNGATCPNIKAP
jgi:N-acetylglucosamine kinase-like BadF-type ATPase